MNRRTGVLGRLRTASEAELLDVIVEEVWDQYYRGEDGTSRLVNAIARHGDLSRLPEHVRHVHAGAPEPHPESCECQEGKGADG